MKKRFTEAQIVGFLREVDAGVAVKDLVSQARVLGSELLPLASTPMCHHCQVSLRATNRRLAFLRVPSHRGASGNISTSSAPPARRRRDSLTIDGPMFARPYRISKE
jgi:hypothetical protein